MTEPEMLYTFSAFVRMGVEEAMPDTYSLGQLVRAQMYMNQHPDFFTTKSLRDVIHFVQDKHPDWWKQYVAEVTRGRPGGYRQTGEDGHTIWSERVT